MSGKIDFVKNKIPLISSRKTTAYVLTDTDIIEKEIPIDSDYRHLDTDIYDGFQLYLKNFCNPLRIDISEKQTITRNICPECNAEIDKSIIDFEGKLIASQKYKDDKEQNAIAQLAASMPRSDNTLLYLLAGSMAINLILGIVAGVF